jgi:hypothetical protein
LPVSSSDCCTISPKPGVEVMTNMEWSAGMLNNITRARYPGKPISCISDETI